jgi:hypothetical protein
MQQYRRMCFRVRCKALFAPRAGSQPEVSGRAALPRADKQISVRWQLK